MSVHFLIKYPINDIKILVQHKLIPLSIALFLRCVEGITVIKHVCKLTMAKNIIPASLQPKTYFDYNKYSCLFKYCG